MFFPVENSHFGRPKTNFRPFQSEKQKQKKQTNKQKTNKNKNKKQTKKNKKKKKKKGLHHFLQLFLLPFPIFHLPFYNFPSFLLNFHPFSN